MKRNKLTALLLATVLALQPGFGGTMYASGYGSHGCVNIPVDAMPEIFDTVEVGDAIILFGKNKWFEPDPETTRILQS